jgi:hypothetical protein
MPENELKVLTERLFSNEEAAFFIVVEVLVCAEGLERPEKFVVAFFSEGLYMPISHILAHEVLFVFD